LLIVSHDADKRAIEQDVEFRMPNLEF
jgi:hypothetical protein